jgi:hypothetical protein
VKGETAIDSRDRIYVALENDQLLCFAPKKQTAENRQRLIPFACPARVVLLCIGGHFRSIA